MLELLKQLTGTFGPSGNEEQVRELIKKEMSNLADEIRTDVMGNLICIKKGRNNGENSKKIMLAAHMDEIGAIATFIEDKGFVRFANLGYLTPHYALGRRVTFRGGTTGVISYEEQIESMKDLKLMKMFIDIGAADKKEAEAKIKVGEAGTLNGELVVSGNSIVSKALDDRAGCVVLIETAKALQNTPNEIYYAFTVQEEMGLRGAKTVAYDYDLDMAIAVDVTATGDTPGSKPMEVKLGAGPTVKIKDASIVCHPLVNRLLIDTAAENNIPYQLEVLIAGGTDIGAIHLTRSGIPSGGVSIPCRYIHSGSETIDMRDLQNAVKLLTAVGSKCLD